MGTGKIFDQYYFCMQEFIQLKQSKNVQYNTYILKNSKIHNSTVVPT